MAESAIVIPLKASVPEFAIDEPLFMVMVPADGERFPPLTSNAPPTLKLLEEVVVPDTVKLLNVSVPPFTIEPPVIVMVPEEGVRVDPVPFVSVLATEKLVSAVTVAASATVSA